MEPINNVGTANYAMTVPQNQAQGYEDYSSMPMVYDPAMEEKSNAASNKTGLVALSAIALGTLCAIGGYKYGKSKAVKDGAKELTDDAKKAFEDQIENLTKEKDALKKSNDEAMKLAEEKSPWYAVSLKEFKTKIKKALKPDGDDAKKVEEKAGEAKKKADDAAKAAEETTTPKE